MSSAAHKVTPPHGDDGQDDHSDHSPQALVRHEKVHNAGAHVEEGEEGEPWLLSYADLVTLLMCFFILFFTLDKTKGGISDPERVKEKLESLIGLDESIIDKRKQTTESAAKKNSTPADKKIVDQVKREMRKIAKELKIVFTIGEAEPGVFEIVILSTNFFNAGRATLTPEGVKLVEGINAQIRSFGEGTTIDIEGHTDGDPLHGKEFPSNWELSSARASSVTRQLVNLGIPQKTMRVIGYADQKPLMQERDERGTPIPAAKKLNRRVTIKVHLPI